MTKLLLLKKYKKYTDTLWFNKVRTRGEEGPTRGSI